ncbi:MAG: YigZ family protein [Fimbriimonadaceae bacterium]|nr:YigZ family protein [Chitinophagales bacterium]
MILPYKYNTVKKFSEGIYTEKGSKFLAFGFHLQNDEKIKSIKEQLRKEHHKAVHVAYAYRLGYTGETEKVSDDGEPAGSAGKPILNVLKKHDLTYCAIFVVRYYGGKKLGIPGLIHAYAAAVNNVLEKSTMEIIAIKEFYKIMCNTAQLNTIVHVINQYGAQIETMNIEDETSNFIISFEREYAETVLSKLKTLWNTQLEYIESV